MHVHQAGYPCVALMGSSISEVQAKLLSENFTGALIMLDGDLAGREGTAKLLADLGWRMWVKAITLPQSTQPDQLSPDDIKTVMVGKVSSAPAELFYQPVEILAAHFCNEMCKITSCFQRTRQSGILTASISCCSSCARRPARRELLPKEGTDLSRLGV